MLVIGDRLGEIIAKLAPMRASVESLFHARNSQSALKLGHARGVALYCISRAGLEFSEFTPAEIKKSVTNNGRADKRQVAAMVTMVLGLGEMPGADEADALAAALCCANRLPSERALKQGSAG